MSRRGQGFYFAVSILGLMLGLWGVRDQWRISGLPQGFDARRLTYPTIVLGTPVGTPEQLRFQIQALPSGTILELDSPGGPERVALDRQLSPAQSLITLISGLFFLAVNIMVFASRTDRGPIRDFFWATMLFGIAILIGGPYPPHGTVWPSAILPLLWVACLNALPVLFVHMTLTFPRKLDFIDLHPRLIPLLSIAAAVLTAAQGATLLRYFYRPGPETWSAFPLPRLLSALFLVGAVGVGCAVLFVNSRRLELTRERQQMKWLLWGFTIGVTPYVFLRTVCRIFGVDSPFPREVDRIFEMAIPIAFTFAVVRYKFLNIDIIIRRSVLYTVLAGVIASVYLFLVFLVGGWIRGFAPGTAPTIPIVAAAVSVALFGPTRRAIGRWVDSTFFKIRYSYAQALLALKAAIPNASGQKELAEMVGTLLESRLQPKSVTVVVRAGSTLQTSWHLDEEEAQRLVGIVEPFLERQGRLLAAPNSTSLPEIEEADYPPDLSAAGIDLAVPITFDERRLGWILLGEKLSERRYIEQDIELLGAVATEAAITLERIQLVQKVAEEALAREKLDEINRLKTDFLSRVSHDLRTPLTSIAWSTQNLIDGVLGEPNPRQREYLNAVKSSADHLTRLVHNILEISRLELGTRPPEFAPMRLDRIVGEATAELKPLAEGREILFDVRLEAGLPSIRADRDKMLQVLINLIDNAIKYSPDGGRVEIAGRRLGDGVVSLTVRDHGPGIADGEEESIFDRFKQGTPSPHSGGGGFGIGLHVVRSFVQLFGGTVTVRNHPGGGAEFACAFREWTGTGGSEK
jgi:signal transduction histidine kinase